MISSIRHRRVSRIYKKESRLGLRETDISSRILSCALFDQAPTDGAHAYLYDVASGVSSSVSPSSNGLDALLRGAKV